MKGVDMRFGFYDKDGNLSPTPSYLASIAKAKSEQKSKHKFVFKRQLTELNGQEIYLRKEQRGRNQFKKLDDIPYKISVLFDAEF